MDRPDHKAVRGISLERTIRIYFQSWIDKDEEAFRNTFSENVVYSECYGPEYHGLGQLMQWFRDWNKSGSVLDWNVKRYLETDNTAIVEWRFHYIYDGEEDVFDGVTIADFNADGRIEKLSEFQSKADHYYPYE